MKPISRFFSAEAIMRLAYVFIQNHKRFPLTLLSSLITTGLLIYYFVIDDSGSSTKQDYKLLKEQQWFITQITMIISLGIPLFFSAEVTGQRKKRFYYYIAILLFLGLYALSNSWQKTEDIYFVVRYFTFVIFGHLVVAYLPFAWPINSQINGFWQYNKTLFIRILTSFLYTITLFLGLSLALFAIEMLFGVELTSYKYMYLWLVLNIYCNTHFFVGGIPEPIEILETKTEYPTGLKYFAQYVLLTLVMIYMLILFIYEAKIIAAWSLPRGWVSLLILACAGFETLAFLLLYPLRISNNWIKRYSKAFYILLLPLITLLFVAIYVRLNEYGFTEFRYFVLLLAIWLFAISVYFIISKADNIKLIPFSLSIIVLLSVVGPWGAFSISDSSQYNRLVEVLEKGKLLKNGKIEISKNQKLDSSQIKTIETSFDYFSRRPSLLNLQPLFSQNLDSLKSLDAYTIKSKLMAYAGDLKSSVVYPEPNIYKTFNAKPNQVISIEGYSYLIQFDVYISNRENTVVDYKGLGKLGLNAKNEVILTENNNTQLILLDLNPVLTKLIQEYPSQYNDGIESENLFISFENKSLRGKLIINNLTINNLDKKKPVIDNISCKILLSRK
ncbi:MAG: DUF4153 domain-containing protein [Spirosomaceae bacterium]|nr:DUF4153 domain-containing protein [Spirosomataceae bacterium]